MIKQYKTLIFLFLAGCFSNAHATAHEGGEACKKLYDDALWEEALNPCFEAARKGDVRAQSILGELYDRKNDVANTRYWLTMASDAGYQEARHMLAQKYYYGGDVFGEQEGWEQDFGKAFAIWKQDAEQGIAASQFMVGLMYFNGEGVHRDNAQAWYWLKVALEGGYVLATDVLMEISREISAEEKRKAEAMLEAYRVENAGKADSI